MYEQQLHMSQMSASIEVMQLNLCHELYLELQLMPLIMADDWCQDC